MIDFNDPNVFKQDKEIFVHTGLTPDVNGVMCPGVILELKPDHWGLNSYGLWFAGKNADSDAALILIPWHRIERIIQPEG